MQPERIDRIWECAKKVVLFIQDYANCPFMESLGIGLGQNSWDTFEEMAEELMLISSAESVLTWLKSIQNECFTLTGEQKARIKALETDLSLLCMELELTGLFEEAAFVIEKRRCHGDYTGYSDYWIVFDSGRRLFISVGIKNYQKNLREQLDAIRYFQANKGKYSAMFRNRILPKNPMLADVEVALEPDEDQERMHLYGTLVFTLNDGVKLVYRSTQVHMLLTRPEEDWFSFNECAENFTKRSVSQNNAR